MSEDRLNRIEKIVESNARAIQALADTVAQEKQQQKGLYEYLGRIASAIAGFYEVQADFYRHLERMDERQAQIIEILNRLTERELGSN